MNTMSKMSSKALDALKKAGKLSDKSVEEIRTTKFVSSKKSKKELRFMKTKEGKWVQPMFYFRGAKGTTNSKKQNELIENIEKSINKFTTKRKIGE